MFSPEKPSPWNRGSDTMEHNFACNCASCAVAKSFTRNSVCVLELRAGDAGCLFAVAAATNGDGEAVVLSPSSRVAAANAGCFFAEAAAANGDGVVVAPVPSSRLECADRASGGSSPGVIPAPRVRLLIVSDYLASGGEPHACSFKAQKKLFKTVTSRCRSATAATRVRRTFRARRRSLQSGTYRVARFLLRSLLNHILCKSVLAIAHGVDRIVQQTRLLSRVLRARVQPVEPVRKVRQRAGQAARGEGGQVRSPWSVLHTLCFEQMLVPSTS
jgi:hypothetical protein